LNVSLTANHLQLLPGLGSERFGHRAGKQDFTLARHFYDFHFDLLELVVSTTIHELPGSR